ncbi:phage scaffolding protein [Virgibacillus salexigens]|uniref:Phage minor structural protein GP20 n=1 Tax=Virgibacillus massiliensis TaxID=1462526 RepID=A0A024QHV2_9BACI|nr:phage scaffolding protein [Virgibacillus massiliensis]CDQ41501.1 Phage minor structural protein GP20 [Virgibacillus massiliensis]
MDLQELLGEELYNQVVEKAGDNKIAVVSDGSYIPKEKFNAVNTEKNDYKQQIADRDEQLNELSKKAKGNEELQQEIDQLKEQNETTKNDYETKLQQKEFDHKLESTLSGAKAKNTKALKALLDMDTIKLDGDTLKGLDTQLEGLKESDPYLFEEDQPEGGGKPSFTTGQHQQQGNLDAFAQTLLGK